MYCSSSRFSIHCF
uniref:Uncharacterized protein n=1 Tax=Rhizophora mucronata TaxID=61149 RepID=A0A2P2NX81_RHIMU